MLCIANNRWIKQRKTYKKEIEAGIKQGLESY